MKITDEELKIKAKECAELYPEMTFSPTTAYMAGYRAAESADKWVPVSERLPDVEDQTYLIAMRNKNKPNGIWLVDMASWSEGEWRHFNSWETVIKWQPLPDSPQTEAT